MRQRVAVVVPTVRPECLAAFLGAWDHLFRRHDVLLVVVRDGERPTVQAGSWAAIWEGRSPLAAVDCVLPEHADLFFRRNDGVRNYGFYYLARYHPDVATIVTLDDDVTPPPGTDPIADHLSALSLSVTTTPWLNTAGSSPHYLRGYPYGGRNATPVMLSHGVWEGVPDFDAPTQLLLGEAIPRQLPYHRGVVPTGALFPLCGMNVAVPRAVLPWFYYAPMGPDLAAAGVEPVQRFADIWLGVSLKRAFDAKGWACFTGASTVRHDRASSVWKNLEQEARGLGLNERWWREGDGVDPYFAVYRDRRERWHAAISQFLDSEKGV